MTSPIVALIMARTVYVLLALWPIILIGIMWLIRIFFDATDEYVESDESNDSEHNDSEHDDSEYDDSEYDDSELLLRAQCTRGIRELSKFKIIRSLNMADTNADLRHVLFKGKKVHTIRGAFEIYLIESMSRIRAYENSWTSFFLSFMDSPVDREVMNIYTYICRYLNCRSDFGGKGYRVIYNGDSKDGEFRIFKIQEISGLIDHCAFYSVVEWDTFMNDKTDQFYLMGQFIGSDSILRLDEEIESSTHPLVSRMIITNDLNLGYAFGNPVNIHDLDLETNTPFDDSVRIDLANPDADSNSESEDTESEDSDSESEDYSDEESDDSSYVESDDSDVFTLNDHTITPQKYTNVAFDGIINLLPVRAKTIRPLAYSTENCAGRLRLISYNTERIMNIDGVRLDVGDRILVDTQGSLHDSENGIYTLIREGGNRDGNKDPWILERSEDALDIQTGMVVFVKEGITHGESTYVVSTTGTIIMNISTIDFTLFSQSQTPSSDSDSDIEIDSDEEFENEFKNSGFWFRLREVFRNYMEQDLDEIIRC